MLLADPLVCVKRVCFVRVRRCISISVWMCKRFIYLLNVRARVCAFLTLWVCLCFMYVKAVECVWLPICLLLAFVCVCVCFVCMYNYKCESVWVYMVCVFALVCFRFLFECIYLCCWMREIVCVYVFCLCVCVFVTDMRVWMNEWYVSMHKTCREDTVESQKAYELIFCATLVFKPN